MAITISTLVPLVVASLAVVLYRYYISGKSKHGTSSSMPLPPGPKGIPILGMTAQVMVPGKKHATLFQEWEERYGGTGVLMIPTLFRKQIIISDAKAAQALLEKRGTLYSYRAPNHFFDKLRANGLNLVAMEGGSAVERVRKMFHEEMSTKAVAQWQSLQASNAYYTASKLLDMGSETTIADVVEKTQKQLTMRTFCGKLSAETWKTIEEIEGEIDRFRTPAIAPLLDLFPYLQGLPEWLPGGGYKQDCRRYVGLNKILWDDLAGEVKRQVADDASQTTIWGNLMRSKAFERYGFTEDDASFIVGHQLGSNFVPAALFEVFFLAMLHHPEVLKRAQEEVDRVIGRDRLPAIDDEKDLPYIRALQLELLRWRPVVPLVQPHLAAQDDEYAGMVIPEGALVWANLQAMSRNEDVYPEASTMKPERYLAEDGTFTRKDEISIFGYGRRRCPGAYLADPILFLNLVTFVWALDIRLLDGVTELPSSDVEKWYTYITFVIPPPFKAKVTARDANVGRLLKEGAGDWLES